jgi:hypothetical protein
VSRAQFEANLSRKLDSDAAPIIQALRYGVIVSWHLN